MFDLRTCTAALAVAIPLLGASAAAAQDFKQGAPAQLPAQPSTVPPPEAAPAPAAAAAPVAVADLKGVVFVTSLTDVVRDGATVPAGGIDVSRTPFLQTPEFAAKVQPLLGKPASLADLNRVSRAVIEAYRANGHALVDVAVPEQDVTGGVVQLVVSEFVVGRVVVQGNEHFATSVFEKGVRLVPGQAVNQDNLIEDLNFLAINPFRRVDVMYRRGEAPLTTDVILQVADRVPFRAYAGFDNSGTPSTRRERISLGLNWGNVFDGDGQLSYQATVSPDLFEDRNGNSLAFQSHSFTLIQPLASRDTILAFGTYQKVSSPIGVFGTQKGENIQGSFRYAHPLFTRATSRLALTFGYDFKQTDNNLLFGATGITQQTQIHQAVIDLSGSRGWTGGVFGLSGALYLSPGGIGDQNTDSAFQPFSPPAGSTLPARTGTFAAKAKYAYTRVSATQNTPLGKTGLEARTRVTFQLATVNLLPSEQLSAAGPGFVRGYDPNAVLGSRGLLYAQELWSPAFSLLGSKSKTQDFAQVGAFIEGGRVSNEDRQATDPKSQKTASTGVSAVWNIGPYLQARADYGWQLKSVGAAGKGSLGHVSVTVGF